MEKIIELKKINALIRIFGGIFVVPSFGLMTIIGKLAYLNKLDWYNFLEYFPYYLIVQIVWFLREYNKVKYYITKIYIEESQIFFQYFKWFKLIEIQYNIVDVSMKRDQLRSIRLRFFVNNKRIITQFEQSFFSQSKWTSELLKEVETKLKPYIKVQKTL